MTTGGCGEGDESEEVERDEISGRGDRDRGRRDDDSNVWQTRRRREGGQYRIRREMMRSRREMAARTRANTRAVLGEGGRRRRTGGTRRTIDRGGNEDKRRKMGDR